MPSESSERKSKMSQENNVINSASEAEAVKEANETSVPAKDSDNGKAKPKKLGKVSIIILISSLVVGIALITLAVLGIVNYIKNNNKSEPAKEDLVFAYDISKGVNTFEVVADQYFTVEFNPEIAKFYTLNIKGAELDGIKISNNNIEPNSENTAKDGYDSQYSVYMCPGQKYTFKLLATDTEASILLEVITEE